MLQTTQTLHLRPETPLPTHRAVRQVFASQAMAFKGKDPRITIMSAGLQSDGKKPVSYTHLVYGLKNAGLTDLLAQLLNRLAEHGVWAAALGTGLLSAALSSVMNNMPSVLLGALSIQASDTAGAVREAMIYANVIGCDLGPKITPIGSLATLLWLHVLARKGMRITWGYYFRIGALLTLPVLLATLSALSLIHILVPLSLLRDNPQNQVRQAMDPQIARRIRAMLQTVVEDPKGVVRARVPGCLLYTSRCV